MSDDGFPLLSYPKGSSQSLKEENPDCYIPAFLKRTAFQFVLEEEGGKDPYIFQKG